MTPERGNGTLRATENEFGGLTVEWINNEGSTVDVRIGAIRNTTSPISVIMSL